MKHESVVSFLDLEVSPAPPVKGTIYKDQEKGTSFLYDGQDWVELPMALPEIIDQCVRDSQSWFPARSQDLAFLALCLAGEAGELANLIKKVERGSHSYDALKDMIQEEAVDAFIYLMNIFGLWQEEGFDLVKAYNEKRNVNLGRFSSKSS